MNFFVLCWYAWYSSPKYWMSSFSSVCAVRSKKTITKARIQTPHSDGALKNMPKPRNNNELYIGWRIYRYMPLVTNFVVFSIPNNVSSGRLFSGFPACRRLATLIISRIMEINRLTQEMIWLIEKGSRNQCLQFCRNIAHNPIQAISLYNPWDRMDRIDFLEMMISKRKPDTSRIIFTIFHRFLLRGYLKKLYY